MVTRFGLALALGLLLALPVTAQTVVVTDDFESYTDTADFLQTWVPTTGNGNVALDSSDPSYLAGVLTTDPFSNPALFPGIEGVGVDHVGATTSSPGMVNQYGGLDPAFTINPTAEQSIELKADIFVGNSGNERMTVGLRSRSPANLIEMGAYNTNTADPRIEGPANPGPADPNFLPSKGYAYRLILFGDRAPDLLTEPNWQYFDLPIELDRLEDTDELVTIADIGAGWHTYTALITPTNVTLTMDLFRDGFRNTMRDEEGNIITGSGEAGVDAEVTWEISTTAAGFNSLRMGGPSGLSSAGSGAMGFDNVLLQLVDAAAPGNDADFDGDGDVDGADFLTWQRNLGAAGALAQGDADGNGTIELADLDVWKQQFSAGAAVPALAAIPEPTTVALSALAILAGLAASRRR